MNSKALKNILSQALTFLVIFLIVNFIYNQFFNKPQEPKTGLHFAVSQNQFGQNDLVKANFENYTKDAITIKNLCPQPSLQVEKLNNGTWTPITHSAKLNCSNAEDIVIKPGEKYTYSFLSWNHDLFGELGFYRLKANIGDKPLESNQFEVTNMSFFSWIWTSLITQPIYNALIFLASIIPGHNLGWAIILLTLLLRTILLFPNQKALKSQKKLQTIQPKLNALKEKHGKDQQKIAQETMALYKEHKVSPFGSCLPMLIQLPILIGLFHVIQGGLDPGNNYLLYGSLKNFDITLVNSNFYGLLELTKINFIALPIIVGFLQFLQLKLSFARQKTKQNPNQKKKKSSEMEIANRSMTYIMPVMIAFFTASTPAGVGLYWACSTIYGIGQQYFVNKSSDKDETTIKVVKSKKSDKPEKSEKDKKNDNATTK